jgi:hypothetical protein
MTTMNSSVSLRASVSRAGAGALCSAAAALIVAWCVAVWPAAAAGQDESKPAAGARAGGRGAALTPGQWVDVVKSVDLKKRGAVGKWQMRDKELVVSAIDDPARLPLPVTPRGAYDVKIEFTRTDGDGTVGVILPVGSRQCLVAVNFGGGPSGIDMIDGRRANENDSAFPGALANDRRYTLEITVRLDQDQASLTATLDGRPLVFYRGPAASLALHKQWAIPTRNALGLAAQADAVFHRVQLRAKSATAAGS